MKSAQDYLSPQASGHLRGGFNTRLQGGSRMLNLDGVGPGPMWAERNAGWEKADAMIRKGEVFSSVKRGKGAYIFKCQADGNAFFCIGTDFINLQVSDNYSFGDTWQEAVDKFIEGVIVD
jgi:hypothetical protein